MYSLNKMIISGLYRGIKAAFGVAGLVMLSSFLGFGALLYATGIPVELGLLMTFGIWALPGQVLLVSMFYQNASMFAIILAVAMSAVRLIPMVVTVMVPARNKKLPEFLNYVAIHYIAATIWVLANRYYGEIKPKRRLMFVIGLGTTLIIAMVATTYLGYYFALTMGPTISTSLIFLTPSFFLISLFIDVKRASQTLAVILPIIITVIISQYNNEFDIIVGGLVGGILAYIIERFMSGRDENKAL